MVSHCGMFPFLVTYSKDGHWPEGTPSPKRTPLNFHPKQQNVLQVRCSQGNVTKEGTARIWPSELFFQRLSATIAFRAAFPLRFRCQNMVHAVSIKGHTRSNEKLPCAHPINMYLIKGVGRPEAQIPSSYKCLLDLSALAVSPCG